MSGGILLSDNNSAPSIVVTQAPTSGETIPHVNLNVVDAPTLTAPSSSDMVTVPSLVGETNPQRINPPTSPLASQSQLLMDMCVTASPASVGSSPTPSCTEPPIVHGHAVTIRQFPLQNPLTTSQGSSEQFDVNACVTATPMADSISPTPPTTATPCAAPVDGPAPLAAAPTVSSCARGNDLLTVQDSHTSPNGSQLPVISDNSVNLDGEAITIVTLAGLTADNGAVPSGSTSVISPTALPQVSGGSTSLNAAVVGSNVSGPQNPMKKPAKMQPGTSGTASYGSGEGINWYQLKIEVAHHKSGYIKFQ
ncbi:hypothetical protein L208DRAFT_1383022 [Tricholoma matsutake]|nr:hypothetical protein L208DRAFT_1383022 [Tricholoma matsutake 945]